MIDVAKVYYTGLKAYTKFTVTFIPMLKHGAIDSDWLQQMNCTHQCTFIPDSYAQEILSPPYHPFHHGLTLIPFRLFFKKEKRAF
jgi:hypothetical protein